VANPEQNKKLVREAFDTLFQPTPTTRGGSLLVAGLHPAQRTYRTGRDGRFDLVKSLPHTLRHGNRAGHGRGRLVMLRGRFSDTGQPAPWIVVDTVRVRNGMLIEHWDVIEDEVSRQSRSATTHVRRHVPETARIRHQGNDERAGCVGHRSSSRNRDGRTATAFAATRASVVSLRAARRGRKALAAETSGAGWQGRVHRADVTLEDDRPRADRGDRRDLRQARRLPHNAGYTASAGPLSAQTAEAYDRGLQHQRPRLLFSLKHSCASWSSKATAASSTSPQPSASAAAEAAAVRPASTR